MKANCVLALCLMLPGRAPAQEEFLPSDLLQQAGEWVNENIDDRVLDALGLDEDRARQFLAELQKQFQGTYVYDLGALRGTATQLLPLLEQHAETQPYAVWLRSRLDYFEVSENLRRAVATKTTNTVRLPAPSPQMERTVWVKMLDQRPVPPAARPHLARLKAIFLEEKVPAELVWIAEVESSFDARARSPAGAAGLFQLMPVTARSLDLSVGVLRDERLEPDKNARAAARYLRQLHGRFGDWRLAFAAYNAGETRVAALLKKHQARTFDEIAAYLPSETQLYVPKIEATLHKREGVALADLKTGRG